MSLVPADRKLLQKRKRAVDVPDSEIRPFDVTCEAPEAPPLTLAGWDTGNQAPCARSPAGLPIIVIRTPSRPADVDDCCWMEAPFYPKWEAVEVNGSLQWSSQWPADTEDCSFEEWELLAELKICPRTADNPAVLSLAIRHYRTRAPSPTGRA